MPQHKPILFLNSQQAEALEKAGKNVLMMGIGTHKSATVKDPWVIDDTVEGVTPYMLWFGMTEVYLTDAQRVEHGREIIQWVVAHMDPFSTVDLGSLSQPFRYYIDKFEENERRLQEISDRCQLYLVNGRYHVAFQVSEDARVLSAQYKRLPDNGVDFSVVYNKKWRRMSIGANTTGPMPEDSEAWLIWLQREQARKAYQEAEAVGLKKALNLDQLTAIMILEGYEPTEAWVQYVRALKLGNFSSRLNKRLPDLTPVGRRLTLLDTGPWGGFPTFQGSPVRKETKIISVMVVLRIMAEEFPSINPGIKTIAMNDPIFSYRVIMLFREGSWREL